MGKIEGMLQKYNLSEQNLFLKDKRKNRIELFQARSGAVMLYFANVTIELTKKQVERLVGSNVYDLPDFDKDSYLKFYK